MDVSQYNLLVYVDWNNSAPALYLLTKNAKGEVEKQVIKKYDEQASTDPSVLQEVMTRAFTGYPAESYGLVLWSHGEGWIPSPLPVARKISTRWIGQDTTNDTTYLNIADIASVLSGFPHLDFILIDACFGQSIELAYELRNYTDYIIGSPTEIPGPGADYTVVVPAMFAKENVGGYHRRSVL
ncbi:MAG: clostripain-related cysteine peptidase [Bacteroides sp.]|nr:clostripain-related cysteine peptidase [Bacteroides sp.]